MIDSNTLEMMKRFGGGFVKTLADLYWTADPINARKLEDAFPEYFAQYKAMYENSKRK